MFKIYYCGHGLAALFHVFGKTVIRQTIISLVIAMFLKMRQSRPTTPIDMLNKTASPLPLGLTNPFRSNLIKTALSHVQMYCLIRNHTTVKICKSVWKGWNWIGKHGRFLLTHRNQNILAFDLCKPRTLKSQLKVNFWTKKNYTLE